MNRTLRVTLASAILLAAQAVLAADQSPRKVPAGELFWPPVPEAEVQKIQAALPDKPQVPPKKPRRLLVFYGRSEPGVPAWNKMLDLLGEKTGAYQATLSQSFDALEGERLKEFDAVFFNNTNALNFPESVKTALPQFVRSGKGFAGNHGSGCHDSYLSPKSKWPEGLEMLGAYMVSGGQFSAHQVKVDDPQSPLTAVFGGKGFRFSDEVYIFKHSREKLRVLLSIDYPNSPDVQKREDTVRKKGSDEVQRVGIRDDHDYAIAWIRPWGEGRVFYCSYGHEKPVAWDPAIVRFFLAGIQYALGDLKADDTPVAAAKQ